MYERERKIETEKLQKERRKRLRQRTRKGEGRKDKKGGREPRMGEKTEKERLALAHLGCPEW